MKKEKNNKAYAEVLDLMQQAIRKLSDINDELDSDPLFKIMAPGKDEMQFEEVKHMSEELHETLLRQVPKLRLLQGVK